jgi:hypothetical protein
VAESGRDLSIWYRECGEHGEAAAVPRGPLFKWMHILGEVRLGEEHYNKESAEEGFPSLTWWRKSEGCPRW